MWTTEHSHTSLLIVVGPGTCRIAMSSVDARRPPGAVLRCTYRRGTTLPRGLPLGNARMHRPIRMRRVLWESPQASARILTKTYMCQQRVRDDTHVSRDETLRDSRRSSATACLRQTERMASLTIDVRRKKTPHRFDRWGAARANAGVRLG